MLEALQQISMELGANPTILFLIIAWTGFWKLIGMWYSAREKQPVWFIAIGLLNTLGILPILYLFIFKDLKKKQTNERKKKTERNSKKSSKKISKRKTIKKKISPKKKTPSKKKYSKKTSSKKKTIAKKKK